MMRHRRLPLSDAFHEVFHLIHTPQGTAPLKWYQAFQGSDLIRMRMLKYKGKMGMGQQVNIQSSPQLRLRRLIIGSRQQRHSSRQSLPLEGIELPD
jgi:hypothetical protein